ncbi:hypothetical protein [Mycobacterium hippophais]|nr:hypothetical protein [Mycobacterium hippophais]
MAVVIGLAATGCSTGGASEPVSQGPAAPTPSAAASVPQPELRPGATAENDPLAALGAGLYAPLRRAGTDPVQVAGYRATTMPTPDSLSVQTFAPKDGTWAPVPFERLAWAHDKQDWVASDNTQDAAAGPQGSRGWPTVETSSDYGTSVTTYSFTDLAGRPLAEGFDAGWSEGAALPQSATAATYSPGARAYFESITQVDPFHAIDRIRVSGGYRLQTMNACGEDDDVVTIECSTPATSFDDARTRYGVYPNSTSTASLRFSRKGDPFFVGTDAPVAEKLDVSVSSGDGPARLTFSTPDPAIADKFSRLFGTDIENFALYEYQGQVVAGVTQPAGTTTTNTGLFNRIAINDVLTRWSPALPQVNS